MSKTVLALSVLLAAGVSLVGVGIGHELWKPDAQSHTSLLSKGAGNPSSASITAAAVSPGLVDINATLDDPGKHTMATGIVLTPTGLVLTNNHVINGATVLRATDVGNGRTYRASIVGYDRNHDIALLRLDGAAGLRTTAFGSSSDVFVGQAIVAVGNAGGVGGTPSAAGGSVIALDQHIVATDESGSNRERLNGLIEVNANVQPGDSGGPLVNGARRVIGVDTAASTGFSFHSPGHRGYVIPINQAMVIAAQIEGGRSSTAIHIGPTAFLGVELSSATSRATVLGVLPGSPAAEVGLARGDVITSLGGRAVDSPTALISLLDQHRPGSRVHLDWRSRLGQRHTATVELVVGPAH
jgi:S1-C subfamily serine protease